MNRFPVAWGIFDPKGALCEVRPTLASAEHAAREIHDIDAVFDETDELLPKREFHVSPLFLEAESPSDSRVVSPSAGARMSEALRLIKAAAFDAHYWATEDDVALSRMRLMNICDEAIASQPSTDTESR